MHNKPLLSVIIPTYNGAEYIEDAIGSVINQTFRDLEIIVVDDGSTDETLFLIEKLAGLYPQIRLLQQPNAGAQAARNNGIVHSYGQFIALLDQDDRWLPSYLEYTLPHLNKFPIVTADLQLINQKGEITDKWKKVRLVSLSLPYILIRAGHVSPSGLVFRKDFWKKIGPFDENLDVTGDIDWLIRSALAGGKINCVPFPLWQYRLHSSNTSRNISLTTTQLGLILERTYQGSKLPAKVIRYRSQAFLIHYLTGASKFYSKKDLPTARHYLEQAYKIAPFLFFSLQTFISFFGVFAEISERDLTKYSNELVSFIQAIGKSNLEQSRLGGLGYFTLCLLFLKAKPGLALTYLLMAFKNWPLVLLEPGIYHTLISYTRIYSLEIFYRLRYKLLNRNKKVVLGYDTK
jgi:glycosyltransferase involved in cell wall biosynthesis